MLPAPPVAMDVMASAISPKTPTGAMSMMTSMRRITSSFRLLKTESKGSASSFGISSRPMPMKMATNTTWSMLPLSDAELKKLAGTRSTSGCSGPRPSASLAIFLLISTLP
jgi:hypothetical protein